MHLSDNFKKLTTSPIIHIVSVLLIIIAQLIISHKSDFVLVPSVTTANCSVYSDASSSYDTGNSIINSFRTKQDGIIFDYTLNAKEAYPYAGFQWNYRDTFLDLSGYNNLIVTIDPESTTVSSFLITLQVFCNGFSDLSNTISLRFLSKELFIQNGIVRYTIPISDFVTPDWWYKRLNTSEYILGKPDLTQTVLVNIQSSADSVGISNVIAIRDLRFGQSNRYLFIYAGIFILFLLLYIITRWIITNGRKKCIGAIPIHYEKISVENCADQDERMITEYIGKNFTNPEFSLLSMSMDIGISTYKISSVIKKIHQLTFKQYLNTIRIAEAKRLLKTSDLQIAQIAYRVGYSTAPHFNRIFKEFTSLSPNAYRSSSDF